MNAGFQRKTRKLQYFVHLMWRADSSERPWCWERLNAKGEENSRRDGWITSPTQWTWIWVTLGDSEGQGTLACCSPWGRKESDTTEWLNNNLVLSTQIQSWIYLSAYWLRTWPDWEGRWGWVYRWQVGQRMSRQVTWQVTWHYLSKEGLMRSQTWIEFSRTESLNLSLPHPGRNMV